MSMDSNNHIPILREKTTPSTFSQLLHPSSFPYSMNAQTKTTPFTTSIIPRSVFRSTSSPSLDRAQQTLMNSSLSFSPYNHNGLINSMGNFLTTDAMSITQKFLFEQPTHSLPTNDRIIIRTNNTSTRPSCHLHYPLLPRPSPSTPTSLVLGNQASYRDLGFKPCDPSIGSARVDVSPTGARSIRKDNNFKCGDCDIKFPTAQAYGGHRSWHSRAAKKRKKAMEQLEATARETKMARKDGYNLQAS